MNPSVQPSSTPAPPIAAGLFYGWVIAALCFLLLGLSQSTTQYLTGVFAVPLAEAFGATRAGVLFATASLMAIAGGTAAPLLGAWLRRSSIRRVMALAIGVMGAGFVALSCATALWQVAVIYALAMAFGTCAINLGANTLVATWFVARRGRALGFAAAGTSVFGFLLPPLASHGIAAFGWRPITLALGLLLLAVMPLMLWLLVDRPEQRGLAPDGGTAPTAVAVAADGQDWTARRLLVQPVFWLIVLPIGACLATCVTLLNNLVPLAIDAGVAPPRAAYLASLVAFSAILGKLGFGFLADRLTPRSQLAIPAALAIGACLAATLGADYALLAAVAVVLGLAFGAATPAWAMLVALRFGRGGFSLAMGLMTPVVSLLLAACIPFAAWVHDRTGHYDGAWLVLAALLAMLVLPTLRRPGGGTG